MFRIDVDAVRDPDESAGRVLQRRGPAADPSGTIGRLNGGLEIPM